MDIFQFVTNLDSYMYHQGDMIAEEQLGDLEHQLFFVIKGKVEVQRILDDDQALRTSYLVPGDFFGFALNSRESRIREEYKAIEVNTKIAFLNSKQIERVGRANPLFFFSLLKHSIEELLALEKEIEKISDRIIEKRDGLQSGETQESNEVSEDDTDESL
ncbi:MAG: Crp/Fnr family transcriptional regulator [Leptospira sp.]|nr:Crp/Fnr family transcriptional regulator [Leptospira sp.]